MRSNADDYDYDNDKSDQSNEQHDELAQTTRCGNSPADGTGTTQKPPHRTDGEPVAPPAVIAGGMPAILLGAPSWLFPHQLMNTLFGDQQQQQQQVLPRAVESASDALTAVVTPAATDSRTTLTSSSTVVIESQPLFHGSSSAHQPDALVASSTDSTPTLQNVPSSSRRRGKSEEFEISDLHGKTGKNDYDDVNSKKECGNIGIRKSCKDGSQLKVNNVVALTRSHFSSPESRSSSYHLLHDDDDECCHNDFHYGSMGDFATMEKMGENQTPSLSELAHILGNDRPCDEGYDTETLAINANDESDSLLKHTYPLTLQRSASSAFGCPYSSNASSSSSSFCNFKTRARVRTFSNSGYSDPGASAFRPVPNKSSSSNDIGSDVGSAISSSVAGAIAATTYSDPLSDSTQAMKTYCSPWRRVMNRMKKGNYTTCTTVNGTDKLFFTSGGKKLKRRLSGRENPNAAGLDGGEDDLDESAFIGLTASLSELHIEGSLPTSSLKSDSNIPTYNMEMNAAGSSSFTKSSPGKIKHSHEHKEIYEIKLLDDRGNNLSSLAACRPEVQYDDPGVALDLSDDSDNEDEQSVPPFKADAINVIERSIVSMPIDSGIRVTHKRNTKEEPSPPIFDQIPCENVEVTPMMVGKSVLGSVRIIASDSMDESIPPSVERVFICEDADNFPYHPLSDSDGEDNCETEQEDVFNVDDIQGDTNIQSARHGHLFRLKHRSPQRNPRPIQHLSPSSSHDSPDSRYSSVGGSPESRISNSNSRSISSTLNSSVDRTINTEGSLVADKEVRDVNRRSLMGHIGIISSNGGVLGRANGPEVGVGSDESETVFSSSTASSTIWPYVSSPRTLRDGATMPVDRFFAGGNVTMSPSPNPWAGALAHPDGIEECEIKGDHTIPHDRTSPAPIISKLLIPKKLSKKPSGGAVNSARELTHSPHTVSSNSISANSSSSSETKKPLKFVAYEFREERESPFDEPPFSGCDAASTNSVAPIKTDTRLALIKPRISKVVGSGSNRPPIVQRPSAYIPAKPPQSPRRIAMIHGRARTPTRTPPPPPSSCSSNAVPRSGSSTPSSPPVIIDGPSNAGAFWIPQQPTIPPRSGTTALAMRSPLQGNALINGTFHDENKSTQYLVNTTDIFDGNLSEVEISAPVITDGRALGYIVSPDSSTDQNHSMRSLRISPRPKLQTYCGDVPTVSPEKSSNLK